ncbi:MAG TPA: YbaK/EbsC family protein [Hyphomicrobiales bacterium]|nr:YbaK/EbsC family protein [Hyphomicrobiales bacterium]
MPIAPTLRKFLDQNVAYELITHEPTKSSTQTAEVCHIPGDWLAKGVVLRHAGGYMLAVLPASRHLRLSELRAQLGNDVRLATEDEIPQLFQDCDPGAVPVIGACYALDVIIDESIDDLPEIYMEGGDHVTLVHMGKSEFARLTAQARHGRFSARI